jgi:phosphatidylglycerophosphatase A
LDRAGIGHRPHSSRAGDVWFGPRFFWFLLILAPGNAAIFISAILASIIVSIITSEEAEKILIAKDPNSVVIDEIVAIPICFLGWILKLGELPSPSYFLVHWKTSLLILFAFRVFDIWKPTPIRQTQRFPHGWGITIDDLLAGIWVAILSLFFVG